MVNILKLKILVHDYAGHPFQIGLSRALARKGHTVVHAYFAGDQGPKGTMEPEVHDNGGSLCFFAVGDDSGYTKQRFLKRLRLDIGYRKAIARVVLNEAADIVISGNTPLWVQGGILVAAKQSGAAFVYWCQDFYSTAVGDFVTAKAGKAGLPIRYVLEWWDKQQLLNSNHVVLITDSFLARTDKWRIPRERISVIPNWGALDDIQVSSRNNPWSALHLNSRSNIALYSGTLGMKHNPDLILAAADNTDAEIVVVGFGIGFDKLSKLDNNGITLLPLQPFKVFSHVLGAADVLIAVIEREAGQFSVPSKILSYLCAGRPIVMAAPANNLASRIVRDSGAGLVVDPEDSQGFTDAITKILADTQLAVTMGDAGRRYAEENFDINIVTSRFENVFEMALGKEV